MSQAQAKPEKQRRVFSADDKEENRKNSSTQKHTKSTTPPKENQKELRARTAAVTPSKPRLKTNIKK